MANCSDMKKDEVYVCEECGMEVKIMKDCECGEDEDCGLMCCGAELTKK